MPSRLVILLSISSLLLFSHLYASASATVNDEEDLSFLEAEDDENDAAKGNHSINDEELDGSDFEDFDDFEDTDHHEQEEEPEDFFSKLDDKDVVVLTERNFTDVIENYKYVMVEFYAPWCGHCKSLAPDYAAAATELKSENVTLAKVDATLNNELAEEYGVQGFPTVYFFIDGEHKPYNGQRTKEGIITWIKKKTGPSINNITNTEDAEHILTSENIVVLGFLNSLMGPESEILVAASKLDDDVNYYQTVNPDVAKLFSIESTIKRPALVLLKKEPEKVSFHDGEFTKSAIAKFVSAKKLPLVIKFTRENGPAIFDSPIKKQVMLFVTSNESEKVLTTFQEAAKLFTGKLIFVVVEMDNEEDGKPVADYFGVTGNAPNILGYTGIDDAKKYFINGEITLENIKAFSEDFLSDKLKPIYKSDPIPETNDEDVKIVVGKNFDEIVLDESKDVLLEVYAPWCGHCQALEPAYNKLAKHLRVIESIVIAKMDGTTNEHPKAKAEGYPTLLFFPAGNKSDEPIIVDSERTVVGLYKFIKKHAFIPFKLQNPNSPSVSTTEGLKEDVKSTTIEKESKDEL